MGEYDAHTEDDDLLPGLDPDHPCPKCGSEPWAPVDGYKRICGSCKWMWSIGDAPEKGRYAFDAGVTE